MGANFLSRSSSLIVSSRSSCSSSSLSVTALRVMRKTSQLSISMPGKSRSRFSAIRSSRRTKTFSPPTGTKRGVPEPTGTLTRAREGVSSLGWRKVTRRFTERFETKGKGCAGSIAWGVTRG